MHQFAKNLISEWRRLHLPVAKQIVVAAVSGGADSVSLLAALDELQTARKLNLKIIVGHFNHQLRGAESEADAEFVKRLAEKFNFPIEIQTPPTKIEFHKGNLEQTARRARYNFLYKLAEKHNAFAVLTGHTLNDQAETFLLRLIRGSGADGLSAMNVVSHFENANNKIKIYQEANVTLPPSPVAPAQPSLIRPLLNWARRETTEKYCQKLDITFRRDTMNKDERFARVRIRKQLIPFLKTFNPKIIEILANTADLLREDAEFLNLLAAEFLHKHQSSLPAEECLHLAPAIRRRVLRIWLERERGNLRKITATHLRAMESLILKNEGNRIIELPGGTSVTRAEGQLIYLTEVEKNRFGN